ncbi:DUF2946 domain-containing protein [Dyella japonica]|uniref:DUF2946 domain-containing protein n=2 Tax=Dyella japonica TaxID=231455 RepID=A0A075JV21_9GAMM|nr:DUF2946 domain-containing protein [Dyella japonica]AIF45956.1 hypothetical protein HY57_01080 [Dyella japonica A8]
MVSWLAWLAMAFVVVAPLVSRVMPVHAAMQDMAGMMSMVAGDCPHVMAGTDHPADPSRPADTTDRCGYCVLLDHQSLVAAHTILHLLPAPPRAYLPVPLHEADTRQTPRQDARPRGPPSLA